MTNDAPQQATHEPRGRLIRLNEVENFTGLKKSTIYALMREGGGFPHPVRLTARAVAWREAEIQAWCAARSSTAEQVTA